MLDPEILGMLLMEDQYPILSEDQLNYLCSTCDDINQACYLGCMMKARADKVKVGPIEIENDSTYWLNLANTFFLNWQDSKAKNGVSRSITGRCIGRADEY